MVQKIECFSHHRPCFQTCENDRSAQSVDIKGIAQPVEFRTSSFEARELGDKQIMKGGRMVKMRLDEEGLSSNVQTA